MEGERIIGMRQKKDKQIVKCISCSIMTEQKNIWFFIFDSYWITKGWDETTTENTTAYTSSIFIYICILLKNTGNIVERNNNKDIQYNLHVDCRI